MSFVVELYVYGPGYHYRCGCDFLWCFLLARPLVFKLGPGTCSVVVSFKTTFPNCQYCQRGEGCLTYDSGGSILPSPVRGRRCCLSYPRDSSLFSSPTSGGSGGIFSSLEKITITPSTIKNFCVSVCQVFVLL